LRCSYLFIHLALTNNWIADVKFAPGSYQYKFFIDGHIWAHESDGDEDGSTEILDPATGSLNRVMYVGRNRV